LDISRILKPQNIINYKLTKMSRNTRNTRNSNTNQSNHANNQDSNVVTRSGRVVKQPERYDTLEFLPGSNNRFTRGRLIDRSFSAKGGHCENYVHNWKPTVVPRIDIDDLSQFTDDEKQVAEILANTFSHHSRHSSHKHWNWKSQDENKHDDSESDPDWKPEDNPDATESDDDMSDELVEEGEESEIEVEEPDSDILEDEDYESDEQDDDDEDSENEESEHHWKRNCQCNNKKPRLEVVGTRVRIHHN
jgi:hypothetical protein